MHPQHNLSLYLDESL